MKKINFIESAKEILASAITGVETPSDEEYYKTVVPTFSQGLIDQYRFFQERVFIPKRVLYPCCDIDASPTMAFRESEVVLIEKNKHAVQALQRNKINAICRDIKRYKPEELFDLVILLNPQLPSSVVYPFLQSRGYILANNYHKNAKQIAENANFENIGTIIPRAEGLELSDVVGDLDKKEWRYADLFRIFRKIK